MRSSMASTRPNRNPIALLGAITTLTLLSSCALPPEQAWRKIRNDGLFSYIAYEIDAKIPDRPSATPVRQRTVPTGPMPSPVLVQRDSGRTTAPTRTVSPSFTTLPSTPTPDGKVLTAISVPSLVGFVRSPYTNPPRLVDVKGSSAGSTMICPYTHRPFIVPREAMTGSSMMATNTSPAPAPVMPQAPKLASNIVDLPTPKPAPAPQVTPSPAPTPQPKVAATSEPKTVTPSPVTSPAPSMPTPSPVASNNAPPTVTPETPATTPKPVQEIPFGAAIAGRPGFVNSPYAARHQLVDVTGLPVGMEVKCPYTGKLFRVPSQDVVTTKPNPGPTPASPAQP